MDDYYIDRSCCLQTGSFGSYFKGYDRVSKRDIAIKICTFPRGTPQEAKILLNHSKHSNIIELLNFFTVDGNRYLVFNQNSVIDLQSFCSRNKPSIDFTISVVTQIADAVRYLHSLPCPVMHRDIKPSVIFLQDQSGSHVKLAGFDLSVQAETNITLDEWILEDDVGTTAYKAPEFYGRTRFYTAAIDVFSLGLTLECLTHYGQGVIEELFPAIAMTPKERRSYQIGKDMYERRSDINLVKSVPGESDSYKKCKVLISMMTCFDHIHRPSMADVFRRMKKMREYTQSLKVNEADYPVDNGSTIPRAMGLFLERDRNSPMKGGGGTVHASLPHNEHLDTQIKSSREDGVLLTEILQENIETVNVGIKTEVSHSEECFESLFNQEFIEELENEYDVVIEFKKLDLKGEQQHSDVFRDMHTELEVEDENHGFVMSYAVQNITDFRCDAIVNSTYPDLDFRHGILAKAIGDSGGKELRDECAKHVKDYGRLQIGDVYVSGPGELYVKYVFHVTSPSWEKHGGTHDTNEYIKCAVMKILQLADDLQLRKIAFPAISAGGFGFPIEVSLMSIFAGVKDYFEKKTKTGGAHVLREVCLVDNNPDIKDVVKSVTKKVFGEKLVKSKHEKCKENSQTINFVITAGKNCGIKMNKILKLIQEKCKGVTGSIQEVCPTWSPMHRSENYKLVELASNSTDYIQLVEIFGKTVDNMEIVKIERVQNVNLYKELLDHKKVIQQDLGKWTPDMEMKVWHGTSLKSADNIKRDGFDLKYCGKKFTVDYGRGLYFGHTPYVSHQYTTRIPKDKQDPDLMYMFRCTALLGNKYERSGKAQGKKFKLPRGKHSVYWKRSERDTDPLKHVHEIVIFRNTQVYPDYLITYKTKRGAQTECDKNN